LKPTGKYGKLENNCRSKEKFLGSMGGRGAKLGRVRVTAGRVEMKSGSKKKQRRKQIPAPLNGEKVKSQLKIFSKRKKR